MKKQIKFGLIGTIGYLLSPLSFWNDMFINIPIAYASAIPFGLISKAFFAPAMVAIYWITNIAGFIIMHKAAGKMIGKEKYGKKQFAKDTAISIAYTLIMVAAVYFGLLKFPTEYLA